MRLATFSGPLLACLATPCPPARVLAQPSPAAPLTATTGAAETTCSVLVRQSTEAARRLLVMRRWIAPCGLSETHQAIPMTIAAGKQAVFEDVMYTPPGCSGESGTFSLIVVSPDVTVADRAVASTPFTLP